MLHKIIDYIKTNHIIMYLFLGVLTTSVNFLVYFSLYNVFAFSATVSNITAWGAAVVVAFVTNKPLVFRSVDWSAKLVIPEFLKFLGCRLFSGVLETAIIYLTVDFLLWNGNLMKLLISVFVVIFNYVASKQMVFSES